MTKFDDLRSANTRRHAAWPGSENIDLAFRGLELGGESGEAQNKIKKLIRAIKGIRGNTEDMPDDLVSDIAEELADVVICVDLIAMDLDINLGQAVREKFDATSRKKDIPVFFDDERPVQSVKDAFEIVMDAWEGRNK